MTMVTTVPSNNVNWEVVKTETGGSRGTTTTPDVAKASSEAVTIGPEDGAAGLLMTDAGRSTGCGAGSATAGRWMMVTGG
jgi:hypothetical protein